MTNNGSSAQCKECVKEDEKEQKIENENVNVKE